MIALDPNNDAHLAILISWWGQFSDDDRGKLFHPSLHGLAPFIRFFTVGDAAHLLFMADEHGIWVAAWTSPFWDGAMFSTWIRPDRRATKAAWTQIQLAYDVAFETYPALFSFTRQPALHATLLKLGFDYAGRLRRAISDSTVYFYELSKEQWLDRLRIARAFRLARREQRETNYARNRVGNQQSDANPDDNVALRESSGEVREAAGVGSPATSQHVVFPDVGSAQNGRG